MPKTKWMISAKKAEFDLIASKYNIDPVVARLIRNRDVIGDDNIDMFLNGDMSKLHDGRLMKGMEDAAALLLNKINNKCKIRIIGDYDVDGISSTYILLKGLKTIGADVDHVIPHRIKDGYGLNDNLINEAHEDAVDTIITCDNGISAYDQIELANEYGITVIVTDHHEVPYEINGEDKRYIIPNAAVVVDPKQENCPYPFKSICGAVVAFKLVEILLGDKYPNVIEELIPFAAMATVCDVMELLDENRIIVKEGIRLMNEPLNVGLKALKIITGLSDKPIESYHFGFILGPTLNATGRLDTAKRALELFQTESFDEACVIATELKELNESRKKMTEDGTKKAVEIIEGMDSDAMKVIVIYLKDFHESIAGIIAGRIKEKYYKPTFVITDAEEGVKGSGRSIEGYDMYDALVEVGDLFTKFGGHKMAAGISLKSSEDIDVLRRRLNENANISENDLIRKLHIDVPMPIGYISQELVESFELMEPTGTGNPKPLFATKNISVISYRKVGSSRMIGKFVISDEYGHRYDMVYFDDLDDFDAFITENFGESALVNLAAGMGHNININIAYATDINEFRGKRTVQIIMKDYCI